MADALDEAELVVFHALRRLGCITPIDPYDPEDCADVAMAAVRSLRDAGLLPPKAQRDPDELEALDRALRVFADQDIPELSGPALMRDSLLGRRKELSP